MRVVVALLLSIAFCALESLHAARAQTPIPSAQHLYCAYYGGVQNNVGLIQGSQALAVCENYWIQWAEGNVWNSPTCVGTAAVTGAHWIQDNPTLPHRWYLYISSWHPLFANFPPNGPSCNLHYVDPNNGSTPSTIGYSDDSLVCPGNSTQNGTDANGEPVCVCPANTSWYLRYLGGPNCVKWLRAQYRHVGFWVPVLQ